MSDLANTPVRAPPAGLTNNLVDPPSIASHVTICNVICTVVVVCIIILRLFTRARLVRSVDWDDYVSVLSVLCWLSWMGMAQYMTQAGLGLHLWDVSVAHYSPLFLRGWTIAAILYSTTMFATKMSILVLYRRLFPTKSFTIRWWIVTVFTAGYSIGGILSSLFACTPISASWDITVKADTCINTAAFYIANGVFNCVSDLLILALPIPIVWKLALRLRQKIVLSAVFTFGSISCVISIIRLQSIIVFLNNGNSDITYDLVGIVIWSQVELTVAIVCACIPTLRPLFDRVVGSILPTDPGSSKDQSQGRYIRTHEGTGAKMSYARYADTKNNTNNNDNIELHDATKNHTHISVVRQDSDNDSTENIMRHDRPLGGLGPEDNGIMVQTSYMVRSGAR